MTEDQRADQLPSRHVLSAAHCITSALSPGAHPISRVRQGYTQLPTDGLFSYSDCVRGEEVLRRCGLVQYDNNILSVRSDFNAISNLPEEEAVELLVSLYLLNQPPPWLKVAVRGNEVIEEYIPERERTTLRSIAPREAIRHLLLVSSADHYEDDKERAALGEKGEEYVAQLCRQQRLDRGESHLAELVQRVSKISDHFGYDIVAPTKQGSLHLEVKTCGKPGPVIISHLTRNQARVAENDARWRLVICRAAPNGELNLLGYTTGSVLADEFPVGPNQSKTRDGRIVIEWTEAKVKLLPGELESGLPPVAEE